MQLLFRVSPTQMSATSGRDVQSTNLCSGLCHTATAETFRLPTCITDLQTLVVALLPAFAMRILMYR